MPDGIETDFKELERNVSELLTLLQDRQPGMEAFYPLAVEHIDEINRLGKKLFGSAPRYALLTTTRV